MSDPYPSAPVPADLIALLAAPQPPQPVWADAQHHAAARLGADIADLITWRASGDGMHGTLRAGHTTLRLRFEQPEPATVLLQLQIPCPADPACPHAWDTVETRAGLAAAVDGNLPFGDPSCDSHTDARWPDE